MATLRSPCLPGADEVAAPLDAFLQSKGLARRLQDRPPTAAGGAPLDLCKLFKVVRGLGGFQRVAARDQWPAVADSMYPPAAVGGMDRLALAVALAVAYRTYLIAFEQHQREQEEAEGALGPGEPGADESAQGQAQAAGSARGLKRPRPTAPAPLAPPGFPSSASTGEKARD